MNWILTNFLLVIIICETNHFINSIIGKISIGSGINETIRFINTIIDGHEEHKTVKPPFSNKWEVDTWQKFPINDSE